MAFFDKIFKGLGKTRDNISHALSGIFQREINDEFFEELEEALIMADCGHATTAKIIEKLKAGIKENKVSQSEAAKQILADILTEIMSCDTPFMQMDGKEVILIVGVNGVGKTTSIGKLAAHYSAAGKRVMLAAGDTFRAAASEQLAIWAERAKVPIVKHTEGADPAAVVFDAISSAKAKNCDLIIIDTAGRLHNKKNLMEELKKIKRVVLRELPEAHVETLLVLDATTGQNANLQAQAFSEAVDITGVVLTKLDGSAKGGVVVAIKHDSGIPVRFVGVGEKIDELLEFDAAEFAKALLD